MVYCTHTRSLRWFQTMHFSFPLLSGVAPILLLLFFANCSFGSAARRAHTRERATDPSPLPYSPVSFVSYTRARGGRRRHNYGGGLPLLHPRVSVPGISFKPLQSHLPLLSLSLLSLSLSLLSSHHVDTYGRALTSGILARRQWRERHTQYKEREKG